MKKIIYTLSLLNLISCNLFKYNTDSNKNIMKKFNIKNFENLDLDKRYTQSRNDTFYVNKNQKLRITTTKTNIQVEENSNDSAYTSVEIYSTRDSLLMKEGKSFHYFPVGIWKEYDSSGKLKKTINYDEKFKFSLDNLIDKMNKEFKVNILDKDRALCNRYFDKTIEKSFYEISHKTTKEGKQLESFLFDGDSGVLLYRVVHYPDDKRGSLYDQYIKDSKK